MHTKAALATPAYRKKPIEVDLPLDEINRHSERSAAQPRNLKRPTSTCCITTPSHIVIPAPEPESRGERGRLGACMVCLFAIEP